MQGVKKADGWTLWRSECALLAPFAPPWHAVRGALAEANRPRFRQRETPRAKVNVGFPDVCDIGGCALGELRGS
jgi:hypothetical protein